MKLKLVIESEEIELEGKIEKISVLFHIILVTLKQGWFIEILIKKSR